MSTVMAQVPDGNDDVLLVEKKESLCVLPAGHPAILSLSALYHQLYTSNNRNNNEKKGKSLLYSILFYSTAFPMDILYKYFIGESFPLKLTVTPLNNASMRPDSLHTACSHLPTAIALSGSDTVADSVFRVTTTTAAKNFFFKYTSRNDDGEEYQLSVPLWHPSIARFATATFLQPSTITTIAGTSTSTSINSRDILLLSDPRISYILHVQWDIMGYITYILRYHSINMFLITLALSVLWLSQSSPPVFILSFLFLVIPLLSVYENNSVSMSGMALPPWSIPWLPLSCLDMSLLTLACCAMLWSMRTIFLPCVCFVMNTVLLYPAHQVLNNIAFCSSSRSMSTVLRQSQLILVLGSMCAVVSLAIHPGAPPLLGTVILISCSAREAWSPFNRMPRDRRQQCVGSKFDWAVVHCIECIPAAVWCYGWWSTEKRYAYQVYTLERMCMLVSGCHAVFKAWATTQRSPRQRKHDMLCWVAALFIGFLGYCGHMQYYMICTAVFYIVDILFHVL